jgi:hypothetical protein
MISDLSSYYVSAFNLKYNFIKNVSKEEGSKKDKSLAALKAGYLAAVSNALVTFESLIKDVIVSNPLLKNTYYEVNFGASAFEYFYIAVNESIKDIVTFKKMDKEDMVTISDLVDLLVKVNKELVEKRDKFTDGGISFPASDNEEIKNIEKLNCK